MDITFLGATQTVTGSKYLVTVDQKKILVDCGLFQGLKELRNRNWNPLPVAPDTIDAVVFTHAHIDHTGYFPLLVKNGFTGKAYCSQATQALCNVLLPDSGYLQEEEAKFANKHGFTSHAPALPLYTRDDALHSLEQLYPIEFRKNYQIAPNTLLTLFPAGHILGASFVQLKHYDTTILFSGDIGRPHDPIMYPPSVIQSIDYLVLESTYGDRLHDRIDPIDSLEAIISRTVARGGTIVIPAFAVGRAQHILYLIYQLKKLKKIADIPVYLDSPMAVSATEIFHKFEKEHKLSRDVCKGVCDSAQYVNSVDESKALDVADRPKIIISASGMLEGGRVIHHVKAFAPDPKNSIILAGYQAEGTRGSALENGIRELKIHGETVSVNAEVQMLHNMSAHADYQEILDWLGNFQRPPRKVFITHGEKNSALAFKKIIEEKLSWDCVVPEYLFHSELT